MPEIIPRIIHQIWLGPLTPPVDAMATWQKFHPEWEYKLWTEQNLPRLDNQQAFDSSDNYPQKSDVLRYELLLKFGGVYVDADEYCLRPIDPLIGDMQQQGYTFLAASEGSLDRPELVANTVLACSKNHAFMGKMVANIDINKPGEAWMLTGPQYLTDMLSKYKPELLLLPAKVFYPIHHRDKSQRKIDLAVLEQDPEIYGVHLWAGTKRAYKPTWYKQPLKYVIYRIRRALNKTFQIK